MHLYTRKNPETNTVNETEHQEMDFHNRMTKEIRRKQYSVGVKSGTRDPDRFYLS